MTAQLSMLGGPPGDPRDAWETPQPVFDELDAIFHFARDLAASDDNHKCPTYYTRQNSASDLDWSALGGWSWLNPPFSKIAEWLRRCIKASVVVMLPANRTYSGWFHDLILPYAAIAWGRGRVQYVPPVFIGVSSVGFASMLAIYGPLSGSQSEQVAATGRWSRPVRMLP
jgi:phage N-6-adenine-methyltransferase